MTRGVLIGAAMAAALAVLVGWSDVTGTPVSQILLACGLVTALSLSRAPRRD
jgi:hypothetical protein